MKKRNLKSRYVLTCREALLELNKSRKLRDVLDTQLKTRYRHVRFRVGYGKNPDGRYVWSATVSLVTAGSSFYGPDVQGRDAKTSIGATLALKQALIDGFFLPSVSVEPQYPDDYGALTEFVH